MDVKDYIKHYDIINPKIVSELIRYANTLSYREASIVSEGKPINKEIRNVEEFPLSRSSKKLTDVKWFNVLNRYINQTFFLYRKDLEKLGNNDFFVETVLDINILKYKENYFYKKHVDHGSRVPRTASIIILLNNDYKGGSLCFDLGGEVYKINPAVGRIIIWPSNFMYPHYVEPVTEGLRYVIVSWAL